MIQNHYRVYICSNENKFYFHGTLFNMSKVAFIPNETLDYTTVGLKNKDCKWLTDGIKFRNHKSPSIFKLKESVENIKKWLIQYITIDGKQLINEQIIIEQCYWKKNRGII